jgi:hypothetical protein
VNAGLKPRLDILPPHQRKLWRELRVFSQVGFVLYGGTAIALRLGHRQSVDFDFFSERDLNKATLMQQSPLSQCVVLQDQPNSLTVLVGKSSESASVKLSFFGGLDFGRVGTPETTEDSVMQIASLDDLMATKLKVVLQRIEAKDYIDIAAMITAGVDLSKGLATARVLYGNSFQPSESLKAMTYFKGGDLAMLPAQDRTVLVKAASSVRGLPTVERLSQQLTS